MNPCNVTPGHCRQWAHRIPPNGDEVGSGKGRNRTRGSPRVGVGGLFGSSSASCVRAVHVLDVCGLRYAGEQKLNGARMTARGAPGHPGEAEGRLDGDGYDVKGELRGDGIHGERRRQPDGVLLWRKGKLEHELWRVLI
jgi:hypothetical protein